jgi:hypothetical protein
LTFTAIENAVAEWKMKKEASLHGGAEDSGQPQEEEEENIYAVVPEPEVRERCICVLTTMLPCAPILYTCVVSFVISNYLLVICLLV